MTVAADADVVVVGAGGAGLGAALEAGRRGARVVVVDHFEEAGGTARTAGGGTCIPGSPLQERLGIEDSPALALEDWLRWGGPSVDEEWARRYLETALDEIYVRFRLLGVDWAGVRHNEGNSVPRWHAPDGGGRAMTRALEGEVRACRSVIWGLGSRVVELVVAGGRVTGVVVEDGEGQTEIASRSVVLATGGFANNRMMVKEHATAAAGAQRVLLGGGLGATGSGHRMLSGVGARFVNLDAVWMYPYGTPDPRQETGERGLVVRGLDGDIWVNAAGERFHDETKRGGATGTPALLRQPDATCWSVIDARVAANLTVADPYYREGATPRRDRIQQLLNTSPHITKAGDLKDLARQAGIDSSGLTATVAAFNGWIHEARVTDPQFSRPLQSDENLTEPPFYAIRFFPIARKNLGGVRTDLEGQVLDTSDRPIPGLFAAGELAGMAGGHINGRAALEGTMFGPSFYSGLVAGRNVVA